MKKLITIALMALSVGAMAQTKDSLLAPLTLTSTTTGHISIRQPEPDDITINGITFPHQANCSNCDVVIAMSIMGYNYDNGKFTKINYKTIKHYKRKRK